ncbi:glycosyltransferase family protein, partial [Chryseobacterium indoltheticum]|uniref:glycosyltransferase family protein n=1 Tax=Chryseobacterium indoltheticum TaxID=254 RepID=UPI003F49A11E
NVEIFPIDEIQYLKYFENCDGILCNAGFETPAEALFMDKKLFVIPIHNQYEQECNACALDKMGIPNSKVLDLKEIKTGSLQIFILK